MSSEPASTAIDWNKARAFLTGRIRPRVFRSAGGGSVEVDDLVQEALIRLHRALCTTTPENLEAFMNVIADRVVKDHWRKQGVLGRIFIRPTEEGNAPEAVDPRPAPEDDWGDPLERIEFVVQGFFRRSQAVRCLHLGTRYFDSRSWEEVALELGEKPAAVRKAWSRCVQQFKQAVEQVGGPLWAWAVEEGLKVSS